VNAKGKPNLNPNCCPKANLTLTPKLKVELKRATNHYYENVSRKGERRTENHWHIRPETYPLGYQDAAALVTN